MNKIVIIMCLLLIPSAVYAANKQFLVPGYGMVDQKTEDEQFLIPGYGIIDEETGAAPSGDIEIRINWISSLEGDTINENKSYYLCSANVIQFNGKCKYCHQ